MSGAIKRKEMCQCFVSYWQSRSVPKLLTVLVFCEADQTWRETREQFVGLVSRPAVAEWSGWIMTQSWLDNKLNHILLTAESISTMSLLHSLNVFLSLLFALLDVGNNLIFFCTQSSALHLGQCIVLFPSYVSGSFATFLTK
jgi:hypothetical protein